MRAEVQQMAPEIHEITISSIIGMVVGALDAAVAEADTLTTNILQSPILRAGSVG